MTMSPLPSDPVSEGPVAHRRSQREAPPGPSLGALLGSRTGHLALAVLVVELLAGRLGGTVGTGLVGEDFEVLLELPSVLAQPSPRTGS